MPSARGDGALGRAPIELVRDLLDILESKNVRSAVGGRSQVRRISTVPSGLCAKMFTTEADRRSEARVNQGGV
jgi:hypothetical protein